MNHGWHFTINQFVAATRNNYKKAYKLSVQHDHRLKSQMDKNPADPDYALVYNRYHPLHVELTSAYVAWKSSGGKQKGETLSVKQLMKLLPARINKIDLKIQEFYEKDSQRYMQLFPNAHKPFYRGSHDSRLSALGALNLTIGSEATLAAVKLMVENSLNELSLAKGQQSGAKSTTATSSSRVEDARIEAMTGQYQNVGFFINKFPRQPGFIEVMFDVATLTNPDQVIWKGNLDAMETHPLLVHTFYAEDMIRVKCTGHANLSVYLASSPGGTDSKCVIIDANKALKFSVSLFEVPDYKQHRYLTLVNNCETMPVRFLVQLY